jgi:hypothetical protein
MDLSARELLTESVRRLAYIRPYVKITWANGPGHIRKWIYAELVNSLDLIS